MNEVAERVAQLGVVREDEAGLAEGQVGPVDPIVTDVPPECIHRKPITQDISTKSNQT